MDLSKLKPADIKALAPAGLSEHEELIRRELVLLRMNDVFAEKGKQTGKKRGLRKSLARVLTQKRMNRMQEGASRG